MKIPSIPIIQYSINDKLQPKKQHNSICPKFGGHFKSALIF